MKPMQLVILKEKTVRKPYSGEVVGVRIQAAYPNKEANVILSTGSGFYTTNMKTTSFAKKFLVDETGDCTNDAELKSAFSRFCKTLKDFYGFTHCQMRATKADPNPEIVEL